MLIIGTVVLGNFLIVKSQTSDSRTTAPRRCVTRAPLSTDTVIVGAACSELQRLRSPSQPRRPLRCGAFPSSCALRDTITRNGDDAMRRLNDSHRDDSGVATIFVIIAMTAILVGAAFAIDVGGYVATARSAQSSADGTVLAVAADCALPGTPIGDYLAYRKDGQTISDPACGNGEATITVTDDVDGFSWRRAPVTSAGVPRLDGEPSARRRRCRS
jgi:hypothetical protein